MYSHRVVGGRIMRTVTLEAADVRAAAKHIMAQLPTPCAERKALRKRIEAG